MSLEELKERLEAEPKHRTQMLEDVFRERITRLEETLIALITALMEKENND